MEYVSLQPLIPTCASIKWFRSVERDTCMSDGLAFSIDDNAIAAVIDQDLDRTIGTAFIFIKPNWAVTAKHVVTECGVWRQDLRLLFSGGNVAARVLYADPH